MAYSSTIIWAGGNGYFDDLEVEQVRPFELGLYEYIDVNDPELWDAIEAAGKIDDDMTARIRGNVEAFHANFTANSKEAAEAAV